MDTYEIRFSYLVDGGYTSVPSNQNTSFNVEELKKMRDIGFSVYKNKEDGLQEYIESFDIYDNAFNYCKVNNFTLK